MPSPPRRIPRLLLPSLLWLVSACASSAPPGPAFPPRADLQVPAKPQLRPEALGSAHALARHNAAVEAWGEALAAQVGRICRWARAMGAADPGCPGAGSDPADSPDR